MIELGAGFISTGKLNTMTYTLRQVDEQEGITIQVHSRVAVLRRDGKNVDSFNRDNLGPVLAAAIAARSLGASLIEKKRFSKQAGALSYRDERIYKVHKLTFAQSELPPSRCPPKAIGCQRTCEMIRGQKIVREHLECSSG